MSSVVTCDTTSRTAISDAGDGIERHFLATQPTTAWRRAAGAVLQGAAENGTEATRFAMLGVEIERDATAGCRRVVLQRYIADRTGRADDFVVADQRADRADMAHHTHAVMREWNHTPMHRLAGPAKAAIAKTLRQAQQGQPRGLVESRTEWSVAGRIGVHRILRRTRAAASQSEQSGEWQADTQPETRAVPQEIAARIAQFAVHRLLCRRHATRRDAVLDARGCWIKRLTRILGHVSCFFFADLDTLQLAADDGIAAQVLSLIHISEPTRPY